MTPEKELLKTIVDNLNEVAPDTLNEGDYGAWHFIELSRAGSEYTLLFENDYGEDSLVLELELDLEERDLEDDTDYDVYIAIIEKAFYDAVYEWEAEWE